MALSHSPRKVVPLASGDDWVPRPRVRSAVPTVTKRVFFCGVVVEGSEGGRAIPPDVQDLIASLGEPLDLDSDTEQEESAAQSSSNSDADGSPTGTRRRAMTNSSALADVTKEFLSTERTYVGRLRTLKADYADPLRLFARSKDTSILPAYAAKTLFGNIDNILPVNEAFLEDLEKMDQPNGPGIGDVALKHFKKLRGFEHYKQYYANRAEAQAIFEREMKKSQGFSAFVDRIKYSSADTKNRIGLRELLMEPVQRIPRYTLMFRTMLKHMAPNEPQRAALAEADEIASKIALAEEDEQTKRAAIMYCLSASIEDFPPALVSHARRFIDCIDVEDVPIDGPSTFSGGGSAAQSGGNLHCTLFLFDDKLVIVRRPSEKGGRMLAGLDNPDKMAKPGPFSLNKKKSGMSCKGMVDLTDVVATDVGGPNFHLYLEDPPQDQDHRWVGRPFRTLSVVHPPSPIVYDSAAAEADKTRFLENLWGVQGRYRTKKGQSVVLCGEEREVEDRAGKITIARTYFNVYTRTAFLQEAKKTKAVLHIDPLGSADPIPFGDNGPPLVIARVQPLAGELSRYKVTSSEPSDDEDEDIVQTARVPDRIVYTIHQYGLFKFRTGKNSMPSTPTATKSRAAIFGLDAISRNLLFHARSATAVGDFINGSTSGHRRTRTTPSVSRSSIYTDTTGDSFSRFSRTNSTTTTATSVMDDQSANMSANSRRSRSLSRAKKLIKRAKSPKDGESGTDQDASPRRSNLALSPIVRVRTLSNASSDTPTDEDRDSNEYYEPHRVVMDDSEHDLAMRLELARRNSQNQSEQQFSPLVLETPLEDTIYENDPPNTNRPFSRASRQLPELPDVQSQRSTTPRPTTPMRPVTPDSARRTRSLSRNSSERRPMGPRTPSPLPPSRSPHVFPSTEIPSGDADDDFILEPTLVNTPQPPVTPTRTPLPRSRRQPFDPTGNLDSTPKAEAPMFQGIVEPLSIVKKTSLRTGNTSPTQGKKTGTSSRGSPKGKGSPRRSSAQNRPSRIPVLQVNPTTNEEALRLIRSVESTKEDIESSRRAIKRIRLEAERLRSAVPGVASVGSSEDLDRPLSPLRPASPLKGLRAPTRTTAPLTREAQARMEEMQRLIAKRTADGTGRTRSQSVFSSAGSAPSASRLSETPPKATEVTRSLEELTDQVDDCLIKALKNQDSLQDNLEVFVTQVKDKSLEIERIKHELETVKQRCESLDISVKESNDEKELMYTLFNEELDTMYNDAQLPDTEGWDALTRDLSHTKQERNVLSLENSKLKRRLIEVEMQNEEWGAILRKHGLIP